MSQEFMVASHTRDVEDIRRLWWEFFNCPQEPQARNLAVCLCCQIEVDWQELLKQFEFFEGVFSGDNKSLLRQADIYERIFTEHWLKRLSPEVRDWLELCLTTDQAGDDIKVTAQILMQEVSNRGAIIYQVRHTAFCAGSLADNRCDICYYRQVCKIKE